MDLEVLVYQIFDLVLHGHHYSLKIWKTCFSFVDFMDALCDPRAFLSAQEKRGEQLKALGIEETDISGDVIQSKGGDKKSSDGKGDGKKEEKKGKLLSCWVCSTRVMTKTKKADLKKKVELEF